MNSVTIVEAAIIFCCFMAFIIGLWYFTVVRRTVQECQQQKQPIGTWGAMRKESSWFLIIGTISFFVVMIWLSMFLAVFGE